MSVSIKKAINEYQATMYKINIERQMLLKEEMAAWNKLHEVLDKDKLDYFRVCPAYPYQDL
jgi:hypothetical protein